jgi:hypothetical protein
MRHVNSVIAAMMLMHFTTATTAAAADAAIAGLTHARYAVHGLRQPREQHQAATLAWTTTAAAAAVTERRCHATQPTPSHHWQSRRCCQALSC